MRECVCVCVCVCVCADERREEHVDMKRHRMGVFDERSTRILQALGLATTRADEYLWPALSPSLPLSRRV